MRIKNNCPCINTDEACSSFLFGLSIASQYIENDTYKKILVVAPEKMSQQINWEDRGTCILFGDAAGAVILGKVEEPYGIIHSKLKTNGTGADLLKIDADGKIQMDGQEIFKFALEKGKEIVEEILEETKLDINEITYIIPHQANDRITQVIGKKLGLPKKMVSTIKNLGNTGSSSIPIALYKLYKTGKLKKGDYIITVAFGAGLTWGANLIRWNLDRKGDDK